MTIEPPIDFCRYPKRGECANIKLYIRNTIHSYAQHEIVLLKNGTILTNGNWGSWDSTKIVE